VERSSKSNTILLRDFQMVQSRAKITVLLQAFGCRGGRHTTRPSSKAGIPAPMGGAERGRPRSRRGRGGGSRRTSGTCPPAQRGKTDSAERRHTQAGALSSILRRWVLDPVLFQCLVVLSFSYVALVSSLSTRVSSAVWHC
jgi:hypothetical protein